MKKYSWFVGISVGMLLSATGCPRRGTGEIDVDSVQRRVDQVDSQLNGFQRALAAKDLVAARKNLERARNFVADHVDELAAYPELGELKDRLQQAAVKLCAAEVQAALSELFGAVREKDLALSRRRLQELQERWTRCLRQHPQEEEIASLRAVVESAPAEIEKLEKALEEEKLARVAEQTESELAEKLRRAAHDLEEAVKIPPPPEKLQQLGQLLQGYRREVEIACQRLAGNHFWAKSLERLNEAEKKLGEKFAGWQRRAELFRLAGEDLPQAEKLNQQALISRHPQEARSLVEQSHAIYSRCLENVTLWLKQEASLGQWKVTWKGTKRDVLWLKAHCKSNSDITGRLLKKVSGQGEAAPEAKRAPDAAPKPADDQTKKQKPRRGRIKRW